MVPPPLLFSLYVKMKWRLSILWLCMFRDQFLAQIDRYSFLWVISQWIIIKILNHSRLVALCEYKSSKLRFFSENATSKIIFACLEINSSWNRLPLDNFITFDVMQLVTFFSKSGVNYSMECALKNKDLFKGKYVIKKILKNCETKVHELSARGNLGYITTVSWSISH